MDTPFQQRNNYNNPKIRKKKSQSNPQKILTHSLQFQLHIRI